MYLEATLRPLVPIWKRIPALLLIGVVLWATLFVSATLLVYGVWGIGLLAGTAVFAVILVFPRGSAIILLVVGVGIDQIELGILSQASAALYSWPAAVKPLLPLTISPYQTMLLGVAGSLALRPTPKGATSLSIPALAWAIPAAMALGMLYGYTKGAPTNLMYHEARGLIFGLIIAYIALKMRTTSPRVIYGAVIVGTIALSLVVLQRWWFHTRAASGAAVDNAFAHEDVMLLGVGFVVSVALMINARNLPTRLMLIAHQLLLIGSVLATTRRSGTLVLLVAILMMAWLLLPKRPVMTIIVAAVFIVGGTAYLGAFWNSEYGALAQPARAIRSEFDPTLQDAGSDTYRDNETFNVIATIRSTPVWGVGFGREFFQYVAMPSLSWWPLQFHTPHNNVLWLWLKMGIFGAAVVLGAWAIALSRSLAVIRALPRGSPVPPLPFVIATVLAMSLAFARVDLALTGSRSIAPIAVAMALAFTLPRPYAQDATKKRQSDA